MIPPTAQRPTGRRHDPCDERGDRLRAVRRAGDRLDLDEELGQEQPGHANERARGPALCVEELIADGANGRELGDVDNENVSFTTSDQPAPAAASAWPTFCIASRVCPSQSPAGAVLPSGRIATWPAVHTTRPGRALTAWL
jgi:hypothetical protein